MSALAVAMILLTPPAPEPAAAAAPAAATRGPRIAVEPAAFDFGRVLPRRTLHKQFSIRNFGSTELAIEGITTSCGCTAALLDDKTIKPGRSATLRVSFETRDYGGKVARRVLIKSNDPERRTLELKLEATITPEPK